MIYIGVDLGYKEPTTIVIVRTKDEKRRFTFMSLDAGTEFEDIVYRVYELMQKLEVPPQNVSAPRFPALEMELSKRFMVTR